jgi:LL-diaminopimelate aminotransferase
LPQLGSLAVTERTKMLWLNYPSNPTAAVAELTDLEKAVEFCRQNGLLLVHDAAYSEITFDGFVAPSVLEVDGASDVALELGSLSKHYNMTGWRIGWAAGSAQAIEALAIVKTNLDSGQFTAIQRAAIAALTGPQDHLDELRAIYQKRRDRVIQTLNGLGWSLEPTRGSVYVWASTLGGRSSVEMVDLLLDHGVFVAPGSGYGAFGDGYFRISLTVGDDRLEEALSRIQRALG